MSDIINDIDLQNPNDSNQSESSNQQNNVDRTIVIDRTVIADRTLLANNNAAMPDDDSQDREGQTLRPETPAVQEQQSRSTQGECFILKGTQYNLVRTLSANSGEAQILLVNHNDQEYVLKVYYPNYDINKKLMQAIHSLHFELIVRLDDFGKTYVDGKHRCYELMEYLQGGTLQEYNLNGDYNQFRRIALQTGAALAYCHHYNILHKDIKPSNFFFRDKEHTQVVLGDFGISSMVENGGNTFHTTQARTPIFAAPEMYADVIDGEVEITPAADYYSLGITLFALWLGENPMSSNERLMMRQKNEGRLPRLDELPPRVRQLIQGLTVVNPQKRWKYDEIERWFLGEDVPVDMSSPFLRYKSFIVDPDRNLVADNLHDLIPMLLENEQLAINYLYNGRIASWLENCGNVKMSTLVKDIVTNRYPVDQKAGLMASIYAMEPSYPYYDVKGQVCEDVHSIAISLLTYKERYALDLQNPNDNLFLWLSSHTSLDINQLQSYFTPDAEPHVAVMKLVYEIDPDVPFMSKHASSNLKDIVRSYGELVDENDDDWHALIDGRLLSWMRSHEDVIACEALRIMTQDQEYSQSLAYKVLYNLDRSAAYDLRGANTKKSVGELLSAQLQSLQHATPEELTAAMQDFIDPNGRFCYYAQLHGWYQEQADALRCFDLNSAENRERLSAYDLHTALYRFCRMLGADPVYLLADGSELKSLRDLENKSLADKIRAELRSGSLHQWMSVFYHEDPTRDFAEEYSYEHELEHWLLDMGKIDVQQLYYKRFTKAKQDTAERIAEVRHEWNVARFREKIWRYAFYLLVIVWLGLILGIGIEDTSIIVEHPYLSIMLPLGGIGGIIVATRSFFNGYGPFLSMLFGAMGVCTAYIPIWILKYVLSWNPSLFTASVVLLTVLYVIVCHFTDFRKDDKSSTKMIREILTTEDVNTSLLEPLYYTFKTKSYRYKSSKFGLLDDISNQVRSYSGESVVHYVLWGLLMLILICEFCLLSPRILNKRKHLGAEKQELIENVQNAVNE